MALATCLIAALAAAPARAGTSVSLTFDDGQASQYTVRSALAARGMHATFYVNSAKVGSSGFYMTWEQATALAADGNEIGGHTLGHVNLVGGGLTAAQKRAEVCDDRQNLVARGFDPVSFAYPFGGGDAAAQAIVRECGYLSARRVGGVVSPNWCLVCGTPRAESVPPLNAFETRTPSFGSGELTLGAMQDVISAAERSGGGWIQLVFHGVCETATCGEGWVKPDTFAALLDWLAPRAGHGTVVRTVREVMEAAPPADPPPPPPVVDPPPAPPVHPPAPPPVDPPPAPPPVDPPPAPPVDAPAPPVVDPPPAPPAPEDPPPPPVDPEPQAESVEPDPAAEDEWASDYLARVLQAGVRSNRGQRLAALLRRGTLKLELPAGQAGSLRVTLSLLPEAPGDAVPLARGRVEVSGRAGSVRLKLAKAAKRQLGRLWVAALELDVTLVPETGAPAHDRRVFVVRRGESR